MNKNKLIFTVFLIIIFITGCTSKSSGEEDVITNPTPTFTSQIENSYPIVGYPAINVPNNAYPPLDPATGYPIGYPAFPTMVVEMGYPIITPTIDPKMNGPKFTINEPVVEGDTEVTGTGPANVPIILIDVTEMGTVLSSTTIDADGNYKFLLDEPLIAFNSVGLQIGDLSGTNFNEEDFKYSEEYLDRPLIGIIFAIASVAKP